MSGIAGLVYRAPGRPRIFARRSQHQPAGEMTGAWRAGVMAPAAVIGR